MGTRPLSQQHPAPMWPLNSACWLVISQQKTPKASAPDWWRGCVRDSTSRALRGRPTKPQGLSLNPQENVPRMANPSQVAK